MTTATLVLPTEPGPLIPMMKPMCDTNIVALTPINDLGSTEYRGFSGGLYPGAKNFRPDAYESAGLDLARAVQPLDRDGAPSSAGSIAMISIGMSNTSREFSQFIGLANGHSRKNPRLLFVDAARDGDSASQVADPDDDYWAYVDQAIRLRGGSAAQVQVAWLKTALAYTRCGFPENARTLQRALKSIALILNTKFPRLKLVYLTSRIYGGYSATGLSPEPVAYESAFAVKWLIEERIEDRGPHPALPWLSWGPYVWADGLTPRSDNLVWERSDFDVDGVHPSPRGALKVANKLLEFFERDVTARPWFLGR
jgi:hypothetical protein